MKKIEVKSKGIVIGYTYDECKSIEFIDNKEAKIIQSKLMSGSQIGISYRRIGEVDKNGYIVNMGPVNLKDYTKKDLIQLFKLGGETYFDIVDHHISWTLNISDDSLNYYYGPAIWTLADSINYIGFIYQDRSTSQRSVVLYYLITKEEYEELIKLWGKMNTDNHSKVDESGYKIMSEETNEYLAEKIKAALLREEDKEYCGTCPECGSRIFKEDLGVACESCEYRFHYEDDSL